MIARCTHVGFSPNGNFEPRISFQRIFFFFRQVTESKYAMVQGTGTRAPVAHVIKYLCITQRSNERGHHTRAYIHIHVHTRAHTYETQARAPAHTYIYIYTHTYACARRVSACIDAQCFCRVKHCRVITISTFLAHAKLSPFFFLPFFSRFFFSKRNKREKMKMELSTGFTGRLM